MIRNVLSSFNGHAINHPLLSFISLTLLHLQKRTLKRIMKLKSLVRDGIHDLEIFS